MINLKSVTKIRSYLFLIAIFSAGFVACGDDESGSGSSSESSGPAAEADLSASVEGTESTTAIGALSEEQAVSLCEAQIAYAQSQISEDQAKRATCALGATFAAGLGMGEGNPTCEEVYAACLMAEAETTEEGAGCTDAPARFMGCTATLSELEACAEEQATMLRTLSTLTCDDLADSSALMPDVSGDPESACAAIQEACPGLIE